MRLFAILFSIAFFVPTVVSAQIIPVLTAPLEIIAVPAVPRPGEVVTFTAENVDNKETATFVWSVDGRVTERGAGLDHVTVRAGNVGARTTVSVSVESGGEVVGTQTYVLIPGELDLVWEANTYTPPFYVGRPVPTGDSLVTISAFPSIVVNGTRLAANTLTYKWYINGAQAPYKTGYGLSSITLAPPLFDSPFTVRVVASTSNGSFTVAASTAIVPQLPDMVLYQKHPLLGVLFNHALSTGFILSDEEITLRLFPLFVTNIQKAVYTWKVNDTPIDTSDTPRDLTLRKTGEGVGRANVYTTLDVDDSLYEHATKNITITF